MRCSTCNRPVKPDDCMEVAKYNVPNGFCICGKPVSLTYCGCPRCTGEKDDVFYTVKPFDWNMGSHGRSGTSYQIMEQRVLATSRCKENADKIVEALNGMKKLKRDMAVLECENNSLKSLNRVTVDEVKEAMRREVGQLTHCRWSSHRKQIVDFGRAVLKRMTGNNHEID